jgi:hypothetical protein
MVANEETKVLTFRVKRSLSTKLNLYLERNETTLSKVLNSYLEKIVSENSNVAKVLEDEELLKIQEQLFLKIQEKLNDGDLK